MYLLISDSILSYNRQKCIHFKCFFATSFLDFDGFKRQFNLIQIKVILVGYQTSHRQ